VALAVPPPGPIRRVAYLGTPDLAVPPLRALVAAGMEVAHVVSQPDRRRGRGSSLGPSPVRAAAQELGITVSDRVDDVVAAQVPLAVVVAYGRLIKPPVLEEVPMVNLHVSRRVGWAVSELARERALRPLQRFPVSGFRFRLHRQSSISTSKISVAFPGMVGGRPFSP
jgi:hypothetical protein